MTLEVWVFYEGWALVIGGWFTGLFIMQFFKFFFVAFLFLLKQFLKGRLSDFCDELIMLLAKFFFENVIVFFNSLLKAVKCPTFFM